MKYYFSKKQLNRILDEIRSRHRSGYGGVVRIMATQLKAIRIQSRLPEYFVVGLSGGLDSSVTAYVLARAVGNDRIIAVNVPRDMHDEGIPFFKKVVSSLGIKKWYIIPIGDIVNLFLKTVIYELKANRFYEFTF